MATADHGEEDEWELVEDDGFVYKRKKRPRLEAAPASPQPDSAAEEKIRRERKRRALTKLRDKYQSEIGQWELLSNTLKALQEKALTPQQKGRWNGQTAKTASSCDMAVDLPRPSDNSSDFADQRLLDDLLLRVMLMFFMLSCCFEVLGLILGVKLLVYTNCLVAQKMPKFKK